MSLVVRTNGDPMSLVALARTQVHAVDGTIPVTNIRTMDEIFSASVAQQRFTDAAGRIVWLTGAGARSNRGSTG
jgi:hypothetical protein